LTGEAIYWLEVVDLEDARSILLRRKLEGGLGSISYKNYQVPSRGMVQRLILAAKNLSMVAVPEAGMNWDWNIKYMIDGMATVEHFLPVPKLYEDILQLFARSGTGTTPTLLVHYGGAWGEQLVWQEPLAFDSKLRRFVDHNVLETISETTSRPRDSWQLFNASISVKSLVDRGIKAHIGAHGEPPLGHNYHAEMRFLQAGGMSNYQVLQCATMSAAITLGLDNSIGSIATGKLADFVIYPPGVNLLEDLSRSAYPRYVSKGGRIWDASSLDQIWPLETRGKQVPYLNVE